MPLIGYIYVMRLQKAFYLRMNLLPLDNVAESQSCGVVILE